MSEPEQASTTRRRDDVVTPGENYQPLSPGRSARRPRARIVGLTDGVMKVVVDTATDQILGAAQRRHDAREVVNIVAPQCGTA